jgi:acetyl-CoA carboxylase carboxyl transferase subunit beta
LTSGERETTAREHKSSSIDQQGSRIMQGFFGKTISPLGKASAKADIPAGVWLKCKGCEQTIAQSALDDNAQVCPACEYHFPLNVQQRIALLSDEGSFQQLGSGLMSVDVLDFAHDKSYSRKLEETQAKTGLKDAVLCGLASLKGMAYALAVMDFRFFGASMGSVVGEEITRLTEEATRRRLPLVIVTASGGARMQEGALSLMQMAKTSGALQRHDEAGLPYIAILTHPTTGGVTASFASLGDVILAEPKALIGFAGPRVIKETTRSELPPGFQSAEFLLEHGLIDRVVHRAQLREELAQLLDYLTAEAAAKPSLATQEAKVEL